jgi:hypothetical protein
MRNMRAVARIGILVAGILLGVTTAVACDCLPKPSLQEAYDSSNVIVTARLKSLQKSNDGSGTHGFRTVTMEVLKSYKGKQKAGDTMIFGQGGGGDCVWEFDSDLVGQEFLFYLGTSHEKGRFWRPSVCGRSAKLADAGDDLTFLANARNHAAASASAPSGIQGIDFRNFTYAVYCGNDKNPWSMRARNGKAVEEGEAGDPGISFEVRSVNFGDMNGDGIEDAIIRSSCNGGGTGHYYEGFIYTMRGGKPRLLTHIPGGDRADGGFHGLSIAHGLVVVETYANKIEGVGICCPDFIDTQRSRWNGKRLVPVGKRSRREFKGWS